VQEGVQQSDRHDAESLESERIAHALGQASICGDTLLCISAADGEGRIWRREDWERTSFWVNTGLTAESEPTLESGERTAIEISGELFRRICSRSASPLNGIILLAMMASDDQ